MSRKLPFYPEIFQTVWKFSRLSRNLAVCQEVFQAVQKSSRLSTKYPDRPEHCLDQPELFHTGPEIFKTLRKSSGLSRNLQDYWEVFQTVWKSSWQSRTFPRLYGNLSDCQELLQTVQKSYNRLSGNLPDCPEMFKILTKGFIFLNDFFIGNFFFNFFLKLSIQHKLSR